MSQQRPVRIQGFSLTELMIVLAVLGLLFAAAIPAMSHFLGQSRFAGAVTTLAADIHEAHSAALAQRRTYTINFTSGGYSVVQTAPLDTLHTRTFPQGITCTATGTATFFAWGLTTPVDVTVRKGTTTRVLRLAANGAVTK